MRLSARHISGCARLLIVLNTGDIAVRNNCLILTSMFMHVAIFANGVRRRNGIKRIDRRRGLDTRPKVRTRIRQRMQNKQTSKVSV